MSVISSASVDQRLPEEPALEDEQQQLEKKLPGKAVFTSVLYHRDFLFPRQRWRKNKFSFRRSCYVPLTGLS